jgi:hypothetical protein
MILYKGKDTLNEQLARNCERAERLIGEQLKRRGWREEALEQRRKGDVLKVQLAQRLRAETTMPLKWIHHWSTAQSRSLDQDWVSTMFWRWDLPNARLEIGRPYGVWDYRMTFFIVHA